MTKWECKLCKFVYDSDKGIPERNINPGKNFEDLSNGFKCPKCGVKKSMFIKID